MKIPLALCTAVALSGCDATEPVDRQFGDQHLKTTVALLELHRVRTGSFPAAITDLEYVGAWDVIALQSVRYVAAEDRQSYCVEVERGWMGKPELTPPEGFWTGTGYQPALCGDKSD